MSEESIPNQPGRSRWKGKLGITTILFLLLTLWCAISCVQAMLLNFTPLELPLSLKGPDVYEADFNIEVKSEYAGYKVMLLDYDSYPGNPAKSKDLLTQMAANWTIIHQGVEVSCSPYESVTVGDWSDNSIGRHLCHFVDEPGKYHIVFRFLKKPDSAVFGNPKLALQITLGGMEYKDYAVKKQAAYFGALLFGGIACILLFFLYHPAIREKWGVPLLVLLVIFLWIFIFPR